MVRRALFLAWATSLCACNTLFGIQPVEVLCETGADCASGFCSADFTCDDSQWARSFPGAIDPDINLVTVGDAGRFAVAGSFEGTLDLGGAQLISADGLDAFVALFESDGELVWARQLSGVGHQRATALFHAAGALFVGGSFDQALETPTVSLPGQATAIHGFVARLGLGGDVEWANPIASDGAVTVADVFGSDFGVVATGHYVGRAGFGELTTSDSGGLSWGHVATFDAAGVPIDLSEITGTGNVLPQFVATDGLTGAIFYLAGVFDGVMDEGPTSAGLRDIFRVTIVGTDAAFASDGQATDDSITGFASDNDGNLVSSVLVSDGSIDVVALTRRGLDDMVNVFTVSDNVTTGSERFAVEALVVAPDDDAVLTGSVLGEVDFDGVALSGDPDIFLLDVAEDGEPLAATLRLFRGVGADRGAAVGVDGEHRLVAGTFEQELVVGNAEGEVALSNDGATELFVARIR